MRFKNSISPTIFSIECSNIGNERVGTLWSRFDRRSFSRLVFGIGFGIRVGISVSFLSRPIHCKYLSLIESTTLALRRPELSGSDHDPAAQTRKPWERDCVELAPGS